MNNMTKWAARAWKFFTLLGLGLLPTAANAAAFFEVSCNSQAVKLFLVPIFGSMFSECGGVPGAFEKTMGVFNAGMMTIGGIIAAYTLVVGAMQTAHDGDMLGKQWSSMWIPIRTALGVGMVVPVAGGYCVAQMLFGFLIGQGVAFADNVWSKYIDATSTVEGMAPTIVMPAVAELAKGVLISQLCVEGYNSGVVEGMNSKMTAKSSVGARFYGINGGNDCGGVAYNTIRLAAAKTKASLLGTTTDPSALNTVQDAHIAALSTMEKDMNKIALEVVAFAKDEGKEPNVIAAVNASISQYQKTVAASASVFTQKDDMKKFMDAAKEDGWLLAGAWFMKSAQMQGEVRRAIADVPTATSPSLDSNSYAAGGDTGKFVQALAGIVSRSGGARIADKDVVDAAGRVGDSSNPLSRVAKDLSASIFTDGVLGALTLNQDRHPLMAMKDFCDNLMVGAELGIVAGVAMVGASEATKATNGSAWGEVLGVLTLGTSKAIAGAAVGALNAVGWIMIAICSTLLVFAASGAVFLPMLPFLLYFGATCGWLLLCIEAVIAAPLWAVMHLNPHGDGLAGNARQGYLLLLGVTLRPGLITLGYVAALTALGPVLGAFNEVFASAFKMSQTGSLAGLGTSIMMIAIYFGSAVYLIKHVIGFIHKIGSDILRWVGGGKEQMGEAATGLGGAGEKIAGAAGAASVAAATKSLSRQGGRGGDKKEGKEGGDGGGKEQPGAATTEKQDAMPDSDSPSARGASAGDAGGPQTATQAKPGGIQQAPARSSQARPTRGPGEQ
ncbi:DotA/TraY family protein [Janthinobacterium sp. PAMC25594]|uniref:DotA/TraY family protein n=1 Tax=Janthinobacterium sp. PAMC25594 TaxID=2861284 RepID=UPI001C6398FE|nr:DotA/TraY family protein [Janthinobacterium sp. PAMC25594]QYG06247.1 DotA/TraY family protein [Janthinobacterium sp. PAMC25594]